VILRLAVAWSNILDMQANCNQSFCDAIEYGTYAFCHVGFPCIIRNEEINRAIQLLVGGRKAAANRGRKKKMKETIHKYITELAPESKARVTRYFSAEVEEFSILVGNMIATLQNYHRLNPTYQDDDPKVAAYSLMTKGANTIMAAFELALSGYLWEPPIIFRNALEGFASAWDVVHSPKRYELWKGNKKFSSTDSISNLKKAIKPTGKMYGFLSNMYAHISPVNASPSFVVTEGEPNAVFRLNQERQGRRQGR
jgi:hypothetical protein